MIEVVNCPGCNKPPEVKYRKEGWIVCCGEHGHIAMGNTYAQALIFWNRYIEFVKRIDPCSN